jgi:hypothetical protein
MTWSPVFSGQVFFNILKVLEIRYTYEKNTSKLLFNSIWMAAASLAATFIAVDELAKGNLEIFPAYLMGSLVGKYIGMKIDVLREKVPLLYFFSGE